MAQHKINFNFISFLKTVLLVFAYMLSTASVQGLLAQEFYTESGNVRFVSESSVESFDGVSDKLTGKLIVQDSLVDFYIDLNTLDTGIDLRNEHMRENFLETSEFPFASFYGKLTSSIDPEVRDTQNVVVEGEFEIHGVKRKLTTEGSVLFTDSSTINVQTQWILNLHDYNIDIPGFLFLKVSEDIEVNIDADLKRQ